MIEFKLIPLPNTVVNVRTRKECERYLILCELAGWLTKDGENPTFYHPYWNTEAANLCFEAKNRFLITTVDYCENRDKNKPRRIYFEEFLRLQNIHEKAIPALAPSDAVKRLTELVKKHGTDEDQDLLQYLVLVSNL